MPDSSAQPKPFTWSGTSEKAAWLLAEDELSDEKVAEQVKVSPTTLWRWKRHPDFASRIDHNIETLAAAARRKGIARLDRRLAAYQDQYDRLTKIVKERAEDEDMQDVPGGTSGYLVHSARVIGSGENQREIDEYQFDAPLHRELRELEKQIAQDTGQWSEKRVLSGPDGGPVQIATIEVVLDDEDDA